MSGARVSPDVAANRERAEWFKTHKWPPKFPKSKKAKQKVFRYGSIELLRPTISVHGVDGDEMGQGTMPYIRKAFN